MIRIILALAALLAAAMPARPADWPARPITIVVGASAGGFVDIITRRIAVRMSDLLGQQVSVRNRAGAGGNLAAKDALALPADGYTIYATSSAAAINETLNRDKGFSYRDFAVVSIAASTPEIIAIHPARPVWTLDDLAAYAKASPVTYATAGVGSGAHVTTAMFFRLAQAQATHVPFPGGPPAITAVVGGHVDLMAGAMAGGIIPQLREGKLRALAVASAERSPLIPDVPTYRELGFDLVATSWTGYFVSAGTDPVIFGKLNATINAILHEDDVASHLLAAGFAPVYGSASEAEHFLSSEVRKWGAMISGANIGER